MITGSKKIKLPLKCLSLLSLDHCTRNNWFRSLFQAVLLNCCIHRQHENNEINLLQDLLFELLNHYFIEAVSVFWILRHEFLLVSFLYSLTIFWEAITWLFQMTFKRYKPGACMLKSTVFTAFTAVWLIIIVPIQLYTSMPALGVDEGILILKKPFVGLG